MTTGSEAGVASFQDWHLTRHAFLAGSMSHRSWLGFPDHRTGQMAGLGFIPASRSARAVQGVHTPAVVGQAQRVFWSIIMKTRTGPRRPLALAALLLASLFGMTGLTAAAAPAAGPVQAAVSQSVDTQAADRYVSVAWSPSTLGWYSVRSSDRDRAVNRSLDLCNLYKSDNAYDCISAGYAVNAYLALALSWENGPSGYSAGTTATCTTSRST